MLNCRAQPPARALYMPTSGKDTEYLSEMAELQICVEQIRKKYANILIFIRGDGNASSKNSRRVNILNSLISNLNLMKVKIHHLTYHHFVGEGRFDSDLDVLLHPADVHKDIQFNETVSDIICVKSNPEIASHHDLIFSRFVVFSDRESYLIKKSDIPMAPRINHTRMQVNWSEEGIQNYADILSSQLTRIHTQWCNTDSETSMAVLLELTNLFMKKAAELTNPTKSLQTKYKHSSKKVPRDIRKAKHKLRKMLRRFRCYPSTENEEKLRTARRLYHHTVRVTTIESSIKRDSSLFDIIGENPSRVYRKLKSFSKSKNPSIESLIVGEQNFQGLNVADGFYHAMSTLKNCDVDGLRQIPSLCEKLSDYDIISELCRNQTYIPPIDMNTSNNILWKMKKSVIDHNSITPLHFINAGQSGLVHFNDLLNDLISNVNNVSVAELNTAHAIILYKGHQKDKSNARSYRNISTCPVLAKALDMYVRHLYGNLWLNRQASTQYQGVGSSHELASVLLTEVIQYSQLVLNQPLYLLALDAQSAFDRCLRQILITELYKTHVPPGALNLIDLRLANRQTVYEWDGVAMGPASDVTGFEQGGVNSSEYYKIYNNEQLTSAQNSGLGVNIGSGTISAIGQADDVILMSTSLYSLQLLVKLTEEYCQKYRVLLEPGKTQLLVVHPKKCAFQVKYELNCQKIMINETEVKPTDKLEHVGILRNTGDNLAHVSNRILMHKKALYALLPAGLAKGHRGNPAAILRINTLYLTPVLLSGVASLVLSKSEADALDSHYAKTLEYLMKLKRNTPRCIIYFLSGSLPAAGMIHRNQFSLFSMICHLQNDPLRHHAEFVFTSTAPSLNSWFWNIRNLCIKYGLPHPLHLIQNPMNKAKFKKLVKEKVTEYWQKNLSLEVLSRSSIICFNPDFHSISTPHPIWDTVGCNPYEISKATILAQMISGQYRTDHSTRFWSKKSQWLLYQLYLSQCGW